MKIARQIQERFAVKIAPSSLWRYWALRVRPREQAEREAFCEAKAQAKWLIDEMRADPTLDATTIAEIMLANQMVKDRLKLGGVDIMRLYEEHRALRELKHKGEQIDLKRAQLGLEPGQGKELASGEPQPPGRRRKGPTRSQILKKISEVVSLEGSLEERIEP